ncbi:hypothetical protein [Bergeriella denitrificans]|uniref:Phage associated protein n=1 Tax=Bergeriella denitrificans TaxID=494 RepID=A0A378UKW8_BERDE|nr:hypothetical protein [Bergeriella denitrificans]STZ77343.1 phage associated protein [Bergeriella denitrificans]
MLKIIGISHEIEDENTGAIADFHVIEYASIDYKYHTATATVNGYVNRKAFERGRNPLCSHTLTIQTAHIDSDAEISRQWLYGQAVLPEAANSVFAGAELVTADE